MLSITTRNASILERSGRLVLFGLYTVKEQLNQQLLRASALVLYIFLSFCMVCAVKWKSTVDLLTSQGCTIHFSPCAVSVLGGG